MPTHSLNDYYYLIQRTFFPVLQNKNKQNLLKNRIINLFFHEENTGYFSLVSTKNKFSPQPKYYTQSFCDLDVS
ncbi:hypothetical protein, partial [Wandonia haliotis]|uniref:hypothetical protein n=1 Tax=Wandonia haliotis TaxID=574963 RepID=UPI0031D4D25E